MQSNDEPRSDLLETTTSELLRHRRTAIPDETRPHSIDVNHWGIPAAVVTTVLLTIGTAYHLLAHAPTAGTLLLATLALVMGGTTVLYIKAYGLREAMRAEHQLLRDEMKQLRRQHRKDTDELRGLLGQVIGRLDDSNTAHWEALSAALRIAGHEGGEVVPMSRRPGSYSGT